MSSVFDIVGPVMIGPSSSHTAGAARLGKLARYILKEEPQTVRMTLYGSFAKTYKGHGTNRALVAGLLGLNADDERIPFAFDVAKEKGLHFSFEESEVDMGHPNVVRFDLEGASGKRSIVVGRSLGGGRILITSVDGMDVEVTGEDWTLMTLHEDKPGVVAWVTSILAEKNINISAMRVFRKEKRRTAVMIITTDSTVDEETLAAIIEMPSITQIMAFDPL